jgi:hypothetical protein
MNGHSKEIFDKFPKEIIAKVREGKDFWPIIRIEIQ